MRCEEGDNFIYRLVGQCVHLFVGAVLERVGDEDPSGVEPESLGLGPRSVDEGR